MTHAISGQGSLLGEGEMISEALTDFKSFQRERERGHTEGITVKVWCWCRITVCGIISIPFYRFELFHN